jgi:hypothetical protein
MQESAFILSPAGYIMYVGVTAPSNGTGTFGQQFVSPILAGGAFHTSGTGQFPLTGQFSGRQGSIKVTLTTGTAGTAQAVVFLALSSTVMLGVALDSSNRPYAILKDQYGTTVGLTKVVAGAVPSNTPLELTFSWNSKGVVFGSRYSSLTVGGVVTDWVTSPVSTWEYFVPTQLYVGTTLGGLGLADFVGKIGVVQVSDQVTSPVSGSETAETIALSSAFAGAAAVTANAKVVYAATGTMAGTAAVINASATVTGP